MEELASVTPRPKLMAVFAVGEFDPASSIILDRCAKDTVQFTTKRITILWSAWLTTVLNSAEFRRKSSGPIWRKAK
jgi:hypothetical protein